MSTSIRILASERTWIEGDAIRQLEQTAAWPGMKAVWGHADIHPGKGSPVGASFLSQGVFYPTLIGGDCGCGISLYQTDLNSRKAKLQRLESLLKSFDDFDSDLSQDWLKKWNLTEDRHKKSLGTIGLGNHFCEVNAIHEILDPTLFANLALDKEKLFLQVHSGSRGLGEEILRSHTDQLGAKGLSGLDADAYLAKHDYAVHWARANREKIAEKALTLLKSEARQVLDICHNNVIRLENDCYLHRKGATPTDQGPIMIPGSRGALSYLVLPVEQELQLSGQSLPHGAGRKWKRSDCRGRLEHRYSVGALQKTKLGSRVICSDKELLYEEAPEAYKKIESVIDDLQSFGLVKVIASLRPVLTFKKG